MLSFSVFSSDSHYAKQWRQLTSYHHDSCHAFSSWNMLLPSQSRWKKQGHCSSNVFWEDTLNKVWSNCAPLASNTEHNHRTRSDSCYKTLPCCPHTLHLVQRKGHWSALCSPFWKPAELHPLQMPSHPSVWMKWFAVTVCRCRAERTFWWAPTTNDTTQSEVFVVLENSTGLCSYFSFPS